MHRPIGTGQRPVSRPLDQTVLNEEQSVADKVARIMEDLREFDEDKVRATVWAKLGNATGPWKNCDDVGLPLDVPAVMADMRERFGAGDYEIRVTALGRIVGNILFSLAKEKTALAAPAAPPQPTSMSMAEVFAMMMSLQAEGRRESLAAAERQMGMMVEAQKSQTQLLTAIMGTRDGGGGTSVADTIALVAALQGGGKSGGMKEMIEGLAALKSLSEGGSGRNDDDDEGGGRFDVPGLLQDGARMLGPAVRGLADMVTRGRGPSALAAPQLQEDVPPVPHGGHLHLGAPQPGPTVEAAAEPVPPRPPSRYPVLDLVRADVLWCYERGYDPERAAEVVYDVIAANRIPEEQINALGAAFSLSASPLDDLAAEGLDLRARPQWAGQFFAALQSVHADALENLPGDEGG